MPWVRARLRGQVVYAEATESGELAAKGGRVEIRFKPGADGGDPPSSGKQYLAATANLTVLPPGEAPDPPPAAKPRVAKTAEAAPAAADGARPKRVRAKKSASEKGEPSPHEQEAADHETLADAPQSGAPIIVYTDGACTGNPGPAGLGVVVVGDAGHEELSEYLGHGTNNIAELTAILRGVEMVGERAGKLVIHTDSQYAIGVLSKGWKAKANVDLVAQIKEALRRRGRVELRYVKGHAGVPLNERCDELAREAVSRRRTHRATREKQVSA
jgi:ribonuclease HI